MPTNSTSGSNSIMLAIGTSSNAFQLYPFANGPSGYVLKPTNEYPYLVWAPDDTGGGAPSGPVNATNSFSSTNITIDVLTVTNNSMVHATLTQNSGVLFTNVTVASHGKDITLALIQDAAGTWSWGPHYTNNWRFTTEIPGVSYGTNAGYVNLYRFKIWNTNAVLVGQGTGIVP